MGVQPRLRPHYRPLRRGPSTVQLGSGPVLDGLSRGELAVLALLEGTRTRSQLDAAATAHGDNPQVVDQLLALLDGLGALQLPGEARVRGWLQTRRRVLVSGIGALAEAVTAALRTAELARVSHGSWAVDDLDRALRDPGDPQAAAIPDLVVLTATLALDPGLGDPWLRRGVDHLAVVDAGPQVSIGPLVRPRWPADTPCLRCVELHRCDRDPGRAAVLAQVCRPESAPDSGLRPGVDALAGSARGLVPAAAGLTALVVGAHLDGEWLPGGVSMELTHPWPRLDHRRWARHPRCPGHRAPLVATTAARETMAG